MLPIPSLVNQVSVRQKKRSQAAGDDGDDEEESEDDSDHDGGDDGGETPRRTRSQRWGYDLALWRVL